MKKALKKTSNPISKKKSLPRDRNKSNWRAQKEERGDYTNQAGMSREEKIELLREFKEYQIANRLSYDPDNLTLRRYWMLKGFRPSKVLQWFKTDPSLSKEDYFLGKEMLGDKREVGMALKILEPQSVRYNLHTYLPEYKEIDKYHADLKKDEEKKDTVVNIIDCDHGKHKPS